MPNKFLSRRLITYNKYHYKLPRRIEAASLWVWGSNTVCATIQCMRRSSLLAGESHISFHLYELVGRPVLTVRLALWATGGHVVTDANLRIHSLFQ